MNSFSTRKRQSRLHTFAFSPLVYLPEAAARCLQDHLAPDHGSLLFPALRAWRLRVDPRSPNKDYCPWAIEIPLGAFSSLKPELISRENDLEGRQKVFEKIQDYNTLSAVKITTKDPLKIIRGNTVSKDEEKDLPRLTKIVALGFRPDRDILERQGVLFYRQIVLDSLREYGPYPFLFRALYMFLEEAKKAPEMITGRPLMSDGRLPLPRKCIPIDQRPIVNGHRVRGPSWTPEEDAKLINHFKDGTGKLLLDIHFDAQEWEFSLKGRPPRDKAATLARWWEDIMISLKYLHTRNAILARVNHINAVIRKKYSDAKGRIPSPRRADYRNEYLGIVVKGRYQGRPKGQSWLLVGQLQGVDRVFIDTTRTPVLHVYPLATRFPFPFHVQALIPMSLKESTELFDSIEPYHKLNHWYMPSDALSKVAQDLRQKSIDSLTSSDPDVLTEVMKLRKWLDRDLLKHVPDAPST